MDVCEPFIRDERTLLSWIELGKVDDILFRSIDFISVFLNTPL